MTHIKITAPQATPIWVDSAGDKLKYDNLAILDNQGNTVAELTTDEDGYVHIKARHAIMGTILMENLPKKRKPCGCG